MRSPQHETNVQPNSRYSQTEAENLQSDTHSQISPLMAQIGSFPNPRACGAMLQRSPANPDAILQLQRRYGNRYVNRVLQQSKSSHPMQIQAKLKLGAVGDKYEQEADRNSKQVVSQINIPAPYLTMQNQSSQRQITSGEDNKQLLEPVVQRQPNKEVIQRVIIKEYVDDYLLNNLDIPQLSVDANDNTAKRNYEETKMLFEEIKLRYPHRAPKHLIDGVVKRLEQKSIITYPLIREEITNVEKQYKDVSKEEERLEVTEKSRPKPTNDIEKFIMSLEERRGAYAWEGGTGGAFKDWIKTQDPLNNFLPVDAKINCWEAVLASAAEAGLVSISQLQSAYKYKDITEGVFHLLKQKGVKEINHPAESFANDIQAGNVIMIEGGDGPLSHVVAVVKPNPKDYTEIEVMSLWNVVGGGGFTKSKLGDFARIDQKTTIRYSSFVSNLSSQPAVVEKDALMWRFLLGNSETSQNQISKPSSQPQTQPPEGYSFMPSIRKGFPF